MTARAPLNIDLADSLRTRVEARAAESGFDSVEAYVQAVLLADAAGGPLTDDAHPNHSSSIASTAPPLTRTVSAFRSWLSGGTAIRSDHGQAREAYPRPLTPDQAMRALLKANLEDVAKVE